MINIRLYWHQEKDDLDLGRAWMDVLPPPGSLLSFPTPADPNVVWRVETLYLSPAHDGSMAVRRIQGGFPAPDGQVGIYTMFVVPAEGPFHP